MVNFRLKKNGAVLFSKKKQYRVGKKLMTTLAASMLRFVLYLSIVIACVRADFPASFVWGTGTAAYQSMPLTPSLSV
jgi:hypothetical protein